MTGYTLQQCTTPHHHSKQQQQQQPDSCTTVCGRGKGELKPCCACSQAQAGGRGRANKVEVCLLS